MKFHRLLLVFLLSTLTTISAQTAEQWKESLDSIQAHGNSWEISGDTTVTLIVTRRTAIEDGAIYTLRTTTTTAPSTASLRIHRDTIHGSLILGENEEFFSFAYENEAIILKRNGAHDHICTMKRDSSSRSRTVDPGIFENPTAPANLNTLNSRPTAPAVIFLDWDGYTIPAGSAWSNRWFGGAAYTMPPANSISNDDCYALYLTVLEDYSPLNITITTDSTVYHSYAIGSRHRLVITDGHAGTSETGQNWVGGFPSDIPGFLWATGFIDNYSRGQILTHEIGHSFGLKHDGVTAVTYYVGHGTKTTTSTLVKRLWTPNMGDSRRGEVTHFDKAEYPNYTSNYGASTGPQSTYDDFAMMCQLSAIDMMADDHQDTRAVATPLQISNHTIVNGDNIGLIELDTDIDVFSFTTTGGAYDITVSPALYAPNLDIELELWKDDGTVLETSNPTSVAATNISGTLPAGTYYLRIDGVGYLSPTNSTGYSDYGSRGFYSISGTIMSDGTTIEEYTITTSSSENCTISPSGSITVYEGSSKTFSIHADKGYKVDSIKVNGVKVPVETSYTFSNVDANNTLEAWATIDPNANTNICKDLNTWENQAYTAFDMVEHNGTAYIASANVTSQTPPSWPWEDIAQCETACETVAPWTSQGYSAFVPVLYNDTVWVNTAWTSGEPGNDANWLYVGECSGGGVAPTEFTITATAYGTATVSPSGATTVDAGSNKSYLIGKTGGFVDSIKINGIHETDLTQTSYWFLSVTADQTIEVWASNPTAIQEVGSATLSSDKIIFAPNPAPATANEVYFTTPQTLSGVWEVTIYTYLGERVDHQIFSSNGGYRYSWDLRNERGQKVASGMYYVVISVTTEQGRKELYRTMIGVKR